MKGVCVYYLYYNSEIVYIGISNSIKTRISSHKRDKIFDSYTVVKSFNNRSDALQYEEEKIKEYNPIYNIAYNDKYNINDLPDEAKIKINVLKKSIHPVFNELLVKKYKNKQKYNFDNLPHIAKNYIADRYIKGDKIKSIRIGLLEFRYHPNYNAEDFVLTNDYIQNFIDTHKYEFKYRIYQPKNEPNQYILSGLSYS